MTSIDTITANATKRVAPRRIDEEARNRLVKRLAELIDTMEIKEIAKVMNAEGFTTSLGNPVTPHNLSNYVFYARREIKGGEKKVSRPARASLDLDNIPPPSPYPNLVNAILSSKEITREQKRKLLEVLEHGN